MNTRPAYPTDLNDAEWARIDALLPRNTMGRPLKHPPQELFNALVYVLRTGCAWRLLPHDFPPWQTVYTYFRKLMREGMWQHLNDVLRQDVRQAAGRRLQPSAAIIDSQSVKTTEKGGRAAMMPARRSRDANGIW